MLSDARLGSEVRQLNQAFDEGSILQFYISEGKDFIMVEFNGPLGTEYAHKTYTVKFVFSFDYPYAPPKGFFIGAAPDHPFYRFDLDDKNRSTRVTNLNHGQNGIFYHFMPRWSVAYDVTQIKYSLTPEGTLEMNDHMISR